MHMPFKRTELAVLLASGAVLGGTMHSIAAKGGATSALHLGTTNM